MGSSFSDLDGTFSYVVCWVRVVGWWANWRKQMPPSRKVRWKRHSRVICKLAVGWLVVWARLVRRLGAGICEALGKSAFGGVMIDESVGLRCMAILALNLRCEFAASPNHQSLIQFDLFTESRRLPMQTTSKPGIFWIIRTARTIQTSRTESASENLNRSNELDDWDLVILLFLIHSHSKLTAPGLSISFLMI